MCKENIYEFAENNQETHELILLLLDTHPLKLVLHVCIEGMLLIMHANESQ